MNSRSLAVILSLLIPVGCYGQLTPSQKVSDFQQIAGVYNKRYAFLDWKKAALGVDALSLAPWLDRVSRSESDLEYFEIAAEYVASLQDSHSGFGVDSYFTADLGFIVDIYDGKTLVESFDKTILDPKSVPFKIGDELISVDGKPVAALIEELRKYTGDGNVRSSRRWGAFLLTYRPQTYFPRSAEIGETAQLVFKTAAGQTVTADLPWVKDGLAYLSGGPRPDATVASKILTRAAAMKPWMKTRIELDTFRTHGRKLAKGGYFSGSADLAPVFTLPDNFVLHSGNRRDDSVFSGVFTTGGMKIGFLRIPSFEYLSYGPGVLAPDVQDELTFLSDTDGLILDLMRNPGGSGCDAETLASALFTTPFQSLTHRARVTWGTLQSIAQELDLARYYGSDDDIAYYEQLLATYTDAYLSGDNFTEQMPVCGESNTLQPLKDRRGRTIGYKNPVMVLTDELSASAAELMAAILQDNNRALFYGFRTNGAGGSVTGVSAGVFGEMTGAVTVSQLIRSREATAQGLPSAPFIENIGVTPNVVDDYMKAENLTNGGKPFVDRMLKAMVDYVKSKQ